MIKPILTLIVIANAAFNLYAAEYFNPEATTLQSDQEIQPASPLPPDCSGTQKQAISWRDAIEAGDAKAAQTAFSNLRCSIKTESSPATLLNIRIILSQLLERNQHQTNSLQTEIDFTISSIRQNFESHKDMSDKEISEYSITYNESSDVNMWHNEAMLELKDKVKSMNRINNLTTQTLELRAIVDSKLSKITNNSLPLLQQP